MAKVQEYKLSGSTEYRAEDPRSQAVETLTHHISANHPEIMKELALAHATYRPSWITQHPTAVIYDTEDESRYHYDVDKKTSAGKLFDDFQDALGYMTKEQGQEAAKALTERLHMAVGNALGAIGVNYRDQATDPHTGPPRTLETQLTDRFHQSIAGTMEHLVQGDSTSFAYAIESMRNIAEDATIHASGDRPKTLQQEAASVADGGEWTRITQPDHRDRMYDLVSALGQDWSRDYQMHAARDLAKEAVADVDLRISEHLEQINPADPPEKAQLANTMRDYFKGVTDHAALCLTHGPANHDPLLYQLGNKLHELANLELDDFIQNGKIPEPNADHPLHGTTDPTQTHLAQARDLAASQPVSTG